MKLSVFSYFCFRKDKSYRYFISASTAAAAVAAAATSYSDHMKKLSYCLLIDKLAPSITMGVVTAAHKCCSSYNKRYHHHKLYHLLKSGRAATVAAAAIE